MGNLRKLNPLNTNSNILKQTIKNNLTAPLSPIPLSDKLSDLYITLLILWPGVVEPLLVVTLLSRLVVGLALRRETVLLGISSSRILLVHLASTGQTLLHALWYGGSSGGLAQCIGLVRQRSRVVDFGDRWERVDWLNLFADLCINVITSLLS